MTDIIDFFASAQAVDANTGEINQELTSSFNRMFQRVKDFNEQHPASPAKNCRPPKNEKSLEATFGEYLKKQGISVSHQVICDAGIADIVTPDAIYEIKDTLDREAIFSAIGQVSIYRQQINPTAKAFVVGRPFPMAEKAKDAITTAAAALGVEIIFWEQ